MLRIEHDEVQPGQPVGEATVTLGAGLGLELVDQVDDPN
jgi:hypothetical protein